MRRLLFLFCVAATVAARADTLADVRAAIAGLHATAPIHVTIELQQSRKAEGRFANSQSAATVGVDAVSDAEGLHLTVAGPLLHRATAEARAREADPKKGTPVRSTLGDLDAVGVAEDLDFADPLLRLLDIARPVSESRSEWHGTPARLLVLKLTPKLPREATSVWNVRFSEESLRLWVGSDNIPVAAERTQRGSAGFLFLRGEMTRRESWTLAHVNDRLVVVRYESSFAGSGFGQRGEGKTIQTVTIR